MTTPTVALLPHGGRLIEARRLFPDAPAPFVDLSTGLNPWPYPLPPLPDALFAQLPEPEAELELQHIAARAYGAGTDTAVVTVPGSQAAINLLPLLWPRRRVGLLSPLYAEHAASWSRSGAEAVAVARPEDLVDFDAGIVCNPNNPDGRRLSPESLLAVADQMAAQGGLLVVDEAFADFDPAISLVPHLPHPAIVVLRSFGKAYGLAGIRLGFVLTDATRAARLRAAVGPWPVSGPALRIGQQALADQAWQFATHDRLRKAGARLDALLQRHGLVKQGETALFRLVRCAAGPVFQQLGRAGVLVRQFTEYPDWLRFALPGSEDAWCKLAAGLKDIQPCDTDTFS